MFSFIIINYNTAGLTKDCLESVFRYCPAGGFEIIVVDNGSRPGEAELLIQYFGERIKLIANSCNAGFAAANNIGAAVARGDFFFFLNSDTLLDSDAVTPLRKAFAEDKNAAVIAPRLVLKTGVEQEYSYGREKRKDGIAWVSGAALAIRKDMFFKIGGWEEKFFMYFEDVDLCRSVREAGGTIKRLPAVEVRHLVGGSPIPFWRRKAYYYRSKLLYIFKHIAGGHISGPLKH